ncbi:hypothetical protein [Legionella tucsonensis]|uniref:hypothetical protein n=1 Tax=Legionella tucsonensis TaxID=40335 RepID=UPI0007318627|nr:hypothetical protein [Legionella tucsonensis]
MTKKVCVIVGVGPGNGAAFASRFPKEGSFFVKSDDVADTVFWLTQQAPSTWSFEVEIRPFGEAW